MNDALKELAGRLREVLDPEALLRKINYRPETIQVLPESVHAFCPIHREQVFRTLTIKRAKKTYTCSNKSCPGHAGGDLIDLFARAAGATYEDTLFALARHHNIPIDPAILNEHIQHINEIGDNLLEMGVFDEAEKQFDSVLRLNPESIGAMRSLVRACREQGKTVKQHHHLLKLAEALKTAGEYGELAELLPDYIAAHPENHGIRALYIQSMEKLGRGEDAAQEYTSLAQSLRQQGEIDAALELYRRIQALGAGVVDVSDQIIETLASAGRLDEAIAEMTQRADTLNTIGQPALATDLLYSAVELDPSRDDLRLKIADIIAHAGLGGRPLDRFSGVIRHMIQWQAHAPAAQALNTLRAAFPENAELYELKAELDDARGHHEAALESRLHCADLYEQRGDVTAALAVLDHLLMFDPSHKDMLGRRAALLKSAGRDKEASAAFLSIVAEFAADHAFDQAAAAYQAVIDLNPGEVEHLQKQFELYLKSGQEAVAVQKALALARAYLTRKEAAKAARALEAVLHAAGENEQVTLMHAEALESLGRRHEAAEQYLASAKSAIAESRFDVALERLDRSLKCMPEHIESRELRAEMQIRQGRIHQGIGELLALAEMHLKAQDPQSAEHLAQRIQSAQADHLGALQVLAGAYDQMGDIERKRHAQLRIIQLYRRQQDFTRASDVCESILNEDEDFSPALEQLIAITEGTRQTDHAIEQLWKLAQVHARGRRKEDERRVLTDLLQRNPLHADACRRNLELASGQLDTAALAAEVDRCVERFTSAGKREEITQLLEEIVRGEDARSEVIGGLVALYQTAGDWDGVKSTLRLQAGALNREGRDTEAIEVWGQLARLLPEDLNIRRVRIDLMLRNDQKRNAAEEYRYLASYYRQNKQNEAAEAAFQEILKILPEDRRAREGMITLFIDQGNTVEAYKEIEALAGLEVRKGDLPAAVRAYEQVFVFDPKAEEVFHKIIALKKRAGDNAGALKYYEGLMDLYLDDKRPGAFEQAANEAIALDPANWSIRNRLADHMITAGRVPEAEGVLAEMASAQIKMGLSELAEAAAGRIIEGNSDSIRGRVLQAELLALKGNKEGALKRFIELAGSLGDLRATPGQAAARGPFAFGNYEGLTRIKEYTFENYVVGSRNNFAHASALAVSRSPGKNYNPLFLYADVGLGKTHLCHAIANYITEHHANLKILYTMTEDFVEGLITAIQNNEVTAFRNRHRQSDVLIIDDIQFIAGKERAQEEFFHIFNALFESGKQIVITSDRPPKSIAHLENRLRSRFGAGVIVDIQAPDLETRIAILRRDLIQRARSREVNDEAVMALAEAIPANVRDLKGALIQLLARHDATKEPIDADLVAHVTDKLVEKVAS